MCNIHAFTGRCNDDQPCTSCVLRHNYISHYDPCYNWHCTHCGNANMYTECWICTPSCEEHDTKLDSHGNCQSCMKASFQHDDIVTKKQHVMRRKTRTYKNDARNHKNSRNSRSKLHGPNTTKHSIDKLTLV